MSNGYDQFFKNAKKNKKNDGDSRTVTQHTRPTSPKSSQKPTEAENFLRATLKVKTNKKSSKVSFTAVSAFVVLVLATVGTGVGYFFPDDISDLMKKIDIGFFVNADAANETPTATDKSKLAAADNSATKGELGAESASAKGKQEVPACTTMKGYSEEELSHFNKLNERKTELDLRDAELSALEEELHKQRSEIESRIAKLEKIREEVAAVLQDKVEIDQQRVNTLVDFYSNMKPKQAADIIVKLNEDLAIEVLGKMKKKNAAEIMNLLESGKARALSEKFTGYKRR